MGDREDDHGQRHDHDPKNRDETSHTDIAFGCPLDGLGPDRFQPTDPDRDEACRPEQVERLSSGNVASVKKRAGPEAERDTLGEQAGEQKEQVGPAQQAEPREEGLRDRGRRRGVQYRVGDGEPGSECRELGARRPVVVEDADDGADRDRGGEGVERGDRLLARGCRSQSVDAGEREWGEREPAEVRERGERHGDAQRVERVPGELPAEPADAGCAQVRPGTPPFTIRDAPTGNGQGADREQR
ncbi:MAG: hypothetical protein WKF41_04455 [Gaiellaceae bacterium]